MANKKRKLELSTVRYIVLGGMLCIILVVLWFLINTKFYADVEPSPSPTQRTLAQAPASVPTPSPSQSSTWFSLGQPTPSPTSSQTSTTASSSALTSPTPSLSPSTSFIPPPVTPTASTYSPYPTVINTYSPVPQTDKTSAFSPAPAVTQSHPPVSGNLNTPPAGTVFLPAPDSGLTSVTDTREYTYSVDNNTYSSFKDTQPVPRIERPSQRIALGGSFDRTLVKSKPGWDQLLNNPFVKKSEEGLTFSRIVKPEYNFIGITSTSPENFAPGSRVLITLNYSCNWLCKFKSKTLKYVGLKAAEAVIANLKVSFNDPDSPYAGEPGTWYSLAPVLLSYPDNLTKVRLFTFDYTSAGSYSIVNTSFSGSLPGKVSIGKIEVVPKL